MAITVQYTPIQTAMGLGAMGGRSIQDNRNADRSISMIQAGMRQQTARDQQGIQMSIAKMQSRDRMDAANMSYETSRASLESNEAYQQATLNMQERRTDLADARSGANALLQDRRLTMEGKASDQRALQNKRENDIRAGGLLTDTARGYARNLDAAVKAHSAAMTDDDKTYYKGLIDQYSGKLQSVRQQLETVGGMMPASGEAAVSDAQRRMNQLTDALTGKVEAESQPSTFGPTSGAAGDNWAPAGATAGMPAASADMIASIAPASQESVLFEPWMPGGSPEVQATRALQQKPAADLMPDFQKQGQKEAKSLDTFGANSGWLPSYVEDAKAMAFRVETVTEGMPPSEAAAVAKFTKDWLRDNKSQRKTVVSDAKTAMQYYMKELQKPGVTENEEITARVRMRQTMEKMQEGLDSLGASSSGQLGRLYREIEEHPAVKAYRLRTEEGTLFGTKGIN